VAAGLTRWGLASLCGALALASAALYLDDRRSRREVVSFAERFSIDVRRPAYLATAEVAPSADFAAAVLADAALDDAFASVQLSTMNTALRQLWIRAASEGGLELEAAQSLMLRAVDQRPGWPFHRFLLGKLAYVLRRREALEELASRPERWERPLLAAARRAPGLTSVWTFLAGAYVETWPQLAAGPRSRAQGAFAHAFEDEGFVYGLFLPITARLGLHESSRRLPDRTGPLATARDLLARAGEVPGAIAMHRRWERAVRREMEGDAAAVEERSRYEDRIGLLSACDRWLGRQRAARFDDPATRLQAARVLSLWPPDTPGSWPSDARAELARFFLEGRLDKVSAPAVGGTLTSLAYVPDALRAIGFLLLGDRYGYDSLLRASPTVGSLEWTPFWVRLAQVQLADGDLDEVRSTVARIAPSARGECDVLLLRRDLARAGKDGVELAAAESELAALSRSSVLTARAEGAGASLSLCVDPKGPGWIALDVESAGPSLVTYGFDGGRSRTVVISGVAALDVPLSGRSGRRLLTVEPLLGAKVTLRGARLSSSASSSSSSARRLADPAAQAAPTATASVAGMAGSEKLNSTRP